MREPRCHWWHFPFFSWTANWDNGARRDCELCISRLPRYGSLAEFARAALPGGSDHDA